MRLLLIIGGLWLLGTATPGDWGCFAVGAALGAAFGVYRFRRSCAPHRFVPAAPSADPAPGPNVYDLDAYRRQAR